MRKGKAFLIFTIILLTLTVFGIAGTAFARTSSSYKTLNPQKGVPVDKIFSVTLDGQLKESTINTKNVYIKDSDNKNVKVSVKLDSSKKTIIIEPAEKYDYGKSYTIYIKKTVRYQTGRYLKSALKLDFTTMSRLESNNLSIPSVGSIEKLKKLVSEYKDKQSGIQSYCMTDGIINSAQIQKKTSEDTNTTGLTGSSTEYSSTNLQVDGVDEEDTVKTDGHYIYKIGGSRVYIISVSDGNRLKTVNVTDYADKDFTPIGIYVDSKYMTVIGMSYDRIKESRTLPAGKYDPEKDYIIDRQFTKAIIYDISNKESVKQTREIEIEGSYVSSRKIGNKLYLVSNKYIDMYCVENGMKEAAPAFNDSISGKGKEIISFDKIRYFPDSVEMNYLVTAAADISDPQKQAQVQAYVGAGDIVFVSEENMYVSVGKYLYSAVPYTKVPDTSKQSAASVNSAIIRKIPTSTSTLVYKFSLENGSISYISKAEVPGSILNQFSMDENRGYLRIATTTGQSWWGAGTDRSQNNLYILDSIMNIKGKLEGLAEGEKIYSTRFIGDRGYIVTYKKIDPLFVIDLKNPESPIVLGYLKIPGYSQYIHPYDENHIIGIGKDSIEVPDKNGDPGTTRAFYLGMKAALFDITDPENPKEMFVTTIGDRGTESEILWNHKALLFSKEKNLLAFPVSIYELRKGKSTVDAETGYPEYGEFAFQGAVVYNLDLSNGFRLKGKITHYNEMAGSERQNYPYDDASNINRIIYIGNSLYTISDGMIKEIDMNSLTEKDRITLH